MAVLTTTVSAQHQSWSTYDWSVSGSEQSFNEAWADAKMPGGWPDTMVSGVPATAEGRYTYVVGSVERDQVDILPTLFSTQAASRATTALSPFILSSGSRQVALVQRNGGTTLSGSASNGWQRFFYGVSGSLLEPIHRATNARAISVWEAADPRDVRVAICGETYDTVLPLSQASSGWTAATANHPSGFIAVLNGNGDLQWSYHFFAGNETEVDCAVTDLSIRVDGEGNDIVTYCGIFSHGDPGTGTPLSPVLPFAASGSCTGGATVQAAGQWDGFVGRLVRPAAGPTPSLPQFHSIVAGPGQDGLFGLAEIDENQFAVVGSTEASATQGGFPIPTLCGLTGPYVLGAALIFDASAVPGGPLQLVTGTEIGLLGSDRHTMARDVVIGRGAFSDAANWDLLYVVGSTDNAGGSLPGSFQLGSGDVLAGATDGFVAALEFNPAAPALGRWTCRLQGGEYNDGLTGVNAWNEYPDHFTVTGFSEVSDGGGGVQVDIDVATYFFNNATGPIAGGFTGPVNDTNELLRIRRTLVGGSGDDRPCVMGTSNATLVGLSFDTFGLGQLSGESGGGVAVGENGRCNVVGRTASSNYPITTGARGPDVGTDAVRTELDMLRAGFGSVVGVGRTDGTGFQAATPIYPPVPSTGYTGGTTPFCALNQFGDRIGDPTPATGLRRMLIDFEGDIANTSPASTNAAVIVSQPNPVAGTIMVGVLEFGFPPTAPWAVWTGAELWLGAGTFSLHPFVSSNPRSFRFGLAPLPLGAGPVSAQMVCFLSTPVGAGGACSSLYSASAALWLDF